jgi:hypothetical protein
MGADPAKIEKGLESPLCGANSFATIEETVPAWTLTPGCKTATDEDNETDMTRRLVENATGQQPATIVLVRHCVTKTKVARERWLDKPDRVIHTKPTKVISVHEPESNVRE